MKLIYLGIFIFKIIEDALATLRLIVVSNGKKGFGAILQFICTVIWIILTGNVLINFMKDIYKIISFSLGSLVGSYLGNIIEEKIALGTNNLIIKIKDSLISSLIFKLKYQNINFIKIENILIITTSRKKTPHIIKIIKSIDNNAIIISEKVKVFSGLQNHISSLHHL